LGETQGGRRGGPAVRGGGGEVRGGAGDQAGQARGAEYWGLALSDWALRKEGAEADRLFGEAGERYGAALAIKPDKHEALNNWGNALSDWALRKEGAEADRLSGRRGRKLLRAEEIGPGFGAYNLACVSARSGDEDGCRDWLAKSQTAGRLPSKEKLLTDPDLESVRETSWFVELVDSL